SARAEVETYAGQIQQLKNNFNDLVKVVGEVVVVTSKKSGVINFLTKYIEGVNQGIRVWKDETHQLNNQMKMQEERIETARKTLARFVQMEAVHKQSGQDVAAMKAELISKIKEE